MASPPAFRILGFPVQVRPGFYREQVTPPRSGSAGKRITFTASPSGARILGSNDLSGAAGWNDAGGGTWSRGYLPSATQVFVDGARLSLASGAGAVGPNQFFSDSAAHVLSVNIGGANPGGDADDAKVVTDPVVETDTNAAH